MRRMDALKLHTVVEEQEAKTGKKRRVMRYIGPMYPVDLADIRRRVPLMWAALALAAVGFIAAGFIPARGQRTAWVLPFFVLTLLPLYYGVMGAVKVTCIHREQIDEFQRSEGLNSVCHSAVGLALCGGAWLLGELVLMIVYGEWRADEWMFLGCAALALCGGALLVWRMRGVRLGEPIKQESK